ncbi:unnamed protein product [Caretta caretta]
MCHYCPVAPSALRTFPLTKKKLQESGGAAELVSSPRAITDITETRGAAANPQLALDGGTEPFRSFLHWGTRHVVLESLQAGF